MSANGFVWYELVTSDVDAAISFYGKVVGWSAADFPGAPERYVIVSAGDKGVGGVMPPEGMSQPFWLSYVGVPDRDAAVAKLKDAGGKVHRSFDIPEVGAIALVEDPQGAGFAMIQGFSDRPSEAFKAGTPGHANWNELHTSDWKAAWDFYSGQFGWDKDHAMDMGPMGIYQIFAIEGAQAGAMMNNPNVPKPAWLPYFGVESIDAAKDRVTANGGTVTQGPHEVPGPMFIIQATDPQGAMFALVGGK